MNIGEAIKILRKNTKMSDMDGVSEAKNIVKRAHDWGHPAIAITDHINELPDTEKNAYIRATQRIGEWYETMKYNLSNKAEEIE